MKANKSPENTEVTPSKKKLKQARLPFMLISDVSPKVETPQGRKRKLSATDVEPATKVGKISKENEVNDEAVVIIDDDSNHAPKAEKDDKPLNPYVKLVDAAMKKKMQKDKGVKKPKKTYKKSAGGKKDGSKENGCESVHSDDAPKRTSRSQTKVEENGLDVSERTPSPNVEVSICLDPDTPKKDPHLVNLDDSMDEPASKVSASNTTPVQELKPAVSISKENENNTTPKRSERKKPKISQKDLNASTASTNSSQFDVSMASAPSTPTQDKSSANLDVSLNDSTANISASNLTPKQLQKRLEFAKKREEREKEKQEREKKRQQEKEERAKQRQEKEDQKKKEREEKEEAKRREREEKEEQKRKEREEKEKQKELLKKEKEMKEEQKRKEREDKEEQRKKEKEAREEERRKRQEALELEKQEQELKKKKAAEAFVNFFVPKQKVEREQSIGPASKSSLLSSFAIKVDMRLAPTCRVNLSVEQIDALDKLMEQQNSSDVYLKCLKEGTAKPLSSGKTWPLNDKDDDDVMVVEDELPPIDSTGEIMTCNPVPREKLRPKLLSFHENRRPPYWGTWRKKSAFVKPRRPFVQDGKQLDYEVDSDDDWEEEQEGESLDGSACGSDDEAGADDYEIDNEVFVPHGYLSDEEATVDEDDVMSLTPETQKARLKHLEDEFESELKKPTEKLKPRLYGLVWENVNCGKPDNCVDALWNYFGKFAMIVTNDPAPLLQPSKEPEEVEKKKVKKKKTVTIVDGEEQSPKAEKKKKAKSENKESKKTKPEPKKPVGNQPGINSFLKKINT